MAHRPDARTRGCSARRRGRRWSTAAAAARSTRTASRRTTASPTSWRSATRSISASRRRRTASRRPKCCGCARTACSRWSSASRASTSAPTRTRRRPIPPIRRTCAAACRSRTSTASAAPTTARRRRAAARASARSAARPPATPPDRTLLLAHPQLRVQRHERAARRQPAIRGHAAGARRHREQPAGFDVVVSANGTDWSPIVDDGLADPNPIGMRSIASTPYGLAIGSANRADFPATTAVARSGSASRVPTTRPRSRCWGRRRPAKAARSAALGASFCVVRAPTRRRRLAAADLRVPARSARAGFSAVQRGHREVLHEPAERHVHVPRDREGRGRQHRGAGRGAGRRKPQDVHRRRARPPAGRRRSSRSRRTRRRRATSRSWTGSDDLTPPGSLGYDFWLEPLQARSADLRRADVGHLHGRRARYLHVPREGASDSGGNVSPGGDVPFACQAGHAAAPTPAPPVPAGRAPPRRRGVVRRAPGRT